MDPQLPQPKNYNACINNVRTSSESLRSNPREIKALLLRAQAYYSMKKYQLALHDLNAVTAISPLNNVVLDYAFYLKAKNYYKLHKYEYSSININKAVSLNPNNKKYLEFKNIVDNFVLNQK